MVFARLALVVPGAPIFVWRIDRPETLAGLIALWRVWRRMRAEHHWRRRRWLWIDDSEAARHGE